MAVSLIKSTKFLTPERLLKADAVKTLSQSLFSHAVTAFFSPSLAGIGLVYDLLTTLSLQDIVDGTQVVSNVLQSIKNAIAIIDRVLQSNSGTESSESLKRIANALQCNNSLDLTKDFPIGAAFIVRKPNESVNFTFIQTQYAVNDVARVDVTTDYIVTSATAFAQFSNSWGYTVNFWGVPRFYQS